MKCEMDSSWTELQPPLYSKRSREIFARYVSALRKLQVSDRFEDTIDDARDSFIEVVRSSGSERQALLAAGLVLTDLAIQRWQLRLRAGRLKIRAPMQVRGDHAAEKARIRRQELVKRDAQLRQPAVQSFLRSMERSQIFNDKFTAIYSLMRDGRELADGLRKAREHSSNGWASILANVVDPYIQFVTSDEARCAFTGLRLMDIWRYFRHTWTNQYTSVPGRTLMFLVRDRAAPFHPVIGIGALSSPVIQIRERDIWIGWHPDKFLECIQANSTPEIAQHLVKIVDVAIAEMYVDDLLEDDVISRRDLSDPREAVITRLFTEGVQQRRLHYRYVRSRDHKSARRELLQTDDYWVMRARTHLFRSKRATALASYLRARAVFKKAFGAQATAAKFAALASTALGRDTIRTIVKKAKADRVGISVADITVCGAVQPYNAILGGKLVAMLATSPEVVCEYKRRYLNAESEIASSMAGRPIVRAPSLVLLGTTSLYGIGSSQYNRIRIPCEHLGGSSKEAIRYEELGQSEAFGTSQYSDETVDALVDLVQQSSDGQRVNSIFGEGVRPKATKDSTSP